MDQSACLDHQIIQMFKGVNDILTIKHNGSYLPIVCQTSHSYIEGVELIDGVNKDPMRYKTFRLGLQNASLSFEGVFDLRSGVTFNDLQSKKRSRSLIEWRSSVDQDAFVIFGSGYINELSINSAVDDFVKFSGSINVFGQPYLTTNQQFVIQDGLGVAIEDGAGNYLSAT